MSPAKWYNWVKDFTPIESLAVSDGGTGECHLQSGKIGLKIHTN
jgi:hypothetical protein